MALFVLATVFALVGIFVAVMALRFRQGRAEHLRDQPYEFSLWPALRRNIPYGLLPIAGMALVTSMSMFAHVAGARGPAISAAYLVLMLALLVLLVVFMVKRPLWLGPHRDEVAPAAPDEDVEQPPRPIREMTGEELAEWAHGDPEKLRRLLRRYR